VTPRHIALVLAGVAVLGLGLYLYVEVSSTSTAVANVRPRAPEDKPSPEEHEVVIETPDGSAGSAKPSRVGHTFNQGIRDTAAPAPVLGDAASDRPGAGIDPKKDELMATANKAYDHADFDEALVVAKKVLANDPSNVRMLRIMVSASCILEDAPTAQKHYLLLPVGGNDRSDMKTRCDRYGVALTES
jgi:hypothetical protein